MQSLLSLQQQSAMHQKHQRTDNYLIAIIGGNRPVICLKHRSRNTVEHFMYCTFIITSSDSS